MEIKSHRTDIGTNIKLSALLDSIFHNTTLTSLTPIFFMYCLVKLSSGQLVCWPVAKHVFQLACSHMDVFAIMLYSNHKYYKLLEITK